MPNDEVHRPAWLIVLALLGGARGAAAQDDTVRITCDALKPDDAAQVEARTRATLLTTAAGNLTVRIDCAAGTATVRVVAGARHESTVLALTDENPREALLAAVERTLAALEHRSEGAVADFPPPSPVPARRAASVAVVPPPREPEPRPPAPKRRGSRWDIGAGALGELWQHAIGYGARLAMERRWAPWSVGAAFGWLTAPGPANEFRANELHAFAFSALEEQRSTGLRGSLGVGISVLNIAPRQNLVVRTPTTLPVVSFDTELSRPVRFGRAWLLPAVDLRLFPARREVTVDATRRLVLPPLCPSLFLGFGYEI